MHEFLVCKVNKIILLIFFDYFNEFNLLDLLQVSRKSLFCVHKIGPLNKTSDGMSLFCFVF